jgi:hypothetical protein
LKYTINEKSVTLLVVLTGVSVITIILPKNTYFLPNFLYLWVPQAIIFSLLLILKLRLAIIAGSSIVLTISVLYYWIFIKDAMAWIGYFFILPAGFLGAMIYGLVTKSATSIECDEAIIQSAVCTTIGIMIVQFIVCSTVMYCGR